jgi:hypothetical protein
MATISMTNQKGPQNSVRGNAFEQVIADRYNGRKAERKFKGKTKPYDVIVPAGPGYPVCFVEVKLDVSTYSKRRESGKTDYYPSRLHVIRKNHNKMKRYADKEGSMAVYSFSMIPRNEDGTEHENMEDWPEVWTKRENLDRILKESGSSINDCSKWGKKKKKRLRGYRILPLDKIFGDQVNYIWSQKDGILQPRNPLQR